MAAAEAAAGGLAGARAAAEVPLILSVICGGEGAAGPAVAAEEPKSSCGDEAAAAAVAVLPMPIVGCGEEAAAAVPTPGCGNEAVAIAAAKAASSEAVGRLKAAVEAGWGMGGAKGVAAVPTPETEATGELPAQPPRGRGVLCGGVAARLGED